MSNSTDSCAFLIFKVKPNPGRLKATSSFMNYSQLLGKSTEFLVSSMLLVEGRELYLPAVDDHGVDLIVRTSEYNPDETPRSPNRYEFQEIQVKSMSEDGLFAAITCPQPRPNYWFVFFLKSKNLMWLINSEEFCRIASQNKQGANVGKYSLNLKPTIKDPIKFPQYSITDFSKLP